MSKKNHFGFFYFFDFFLHLKNTKSTKFFLFFYFYVGKKFCDFVAFCSQSFFKSKKNKSKKSLT